VLWHCLPSVALTPIYTDYNPLQEILVGVRRRERVAVSLPQDVWQRQIHIWTMAVWEMTNLKEQLEIPI